MKELIVLVLILSSCGNQEELIEVRPQNSKDLTFGINRESSEEVAPTQTYWLERGKRQDIIDFEKSLNKRCEVTSKNIRLSESVYPYKQNHTIAMPVVIDKGVNNGITLNAEYFYSTKDSTILYVSYDWENGRYANLNDKIATMERESGKLDRYNDSYDKILVGIINEFGEPLSSDSIPKVVESQTGGSEYYRRESMWEDDDKVAKLYMIFGSNTYRIRFNYYWKE